MILTWRRDWRKNRKTPTQQVDKEIEQQLSADGFNYMCVAIQLFGKLVTILSMDIDDQILVTQDASRLLSVLDYVFIYLQSIYMEPMIEAILNRKKLAAVIKTCVIENWVIIIHESRPS